MHAEPQADLDEGTPEFKDAEIDASNRQTAVAHQHSSVQATSLPCIDQDRLPGHYMDMSLLHSMHVQHMQCCTLPTYVVS